jgi:hypothetical protein
MAKVPLPERGQPLDVTYIYQLADTINDLSTQVSSATYNYTTIDTVSAGKQNIKTSDARVVGGYVEVANNSTVSAGNEKIFAYDFPSDFKFVSYVYCNRSKHRKHTRWTKRNSNFKKCYNIKS